MVRRELDPQMRSRICELSAVGFSPNKILKLHPELKLSTIKSTIRREATRVNNVSRPRPGRPRTLTEEQRDHIYDLVNHTNPRIKLEDLLLEVDNSIKKRSLQTLLREMRNGKGK
jgi:transposase